MTQIAIDVPRHTRTAGSAGRSVVHALHGMVATSHPLAALVGVDILKRGGTAVDAAIAANAMLGLVEPMSCGIGGDLFAQVWEAHSGRVFGLDASGRAPRQASVSAFTSRGLTHMPSDGPLSWTVPGAVAGWEALRSRFGALPLRDLLEPAAATAEEGFPVSEVIASFWQGAEDKLRTRPESATTFLPGGRAPQCGEVIRNPELARTYREIGREGRDAFYRGRIARAIAGYSEDVGGLLLEADLAACEASWVDPISTTFRDVEVLELPPPGQGLTVLQILNMLEGDDLAALGPESADFWHLFVEAKKLAYADRARFYADPEFARVPVERLLSKEYGRERRKLIDPHRARVGVPPGAVASDTVYIAAVDAQRNCCSLIQSIYQHFGSGMTPPGLGFALQNRGAGFSLDPSHPNRIEPGKRPFHTIIPALALREGRPWFVFGVMGADMQPQGQVQVLVNLLDFGMTVQAAGEAPRIEHVGSATPGGYPEAPGGGLVLAEDGIPEATLAELARRGHDVARTSRNGGGYQGILIDPQTGALQGGSESRSDGCAIGY
ncbi:MAG: gamma-glutamyltransferase [Myxococcales bacterium]